jgi:hypothetical protein
MAVAHPSGARVASYPPVRRECLGITARPCRSLSPRRRRRRRPARRAQARLGVEIAPGPCPRTGMVYRRARAPCTGCRRPAGALPSRRSRPRRCKIIRSLPAVIPFFSVPLGFSYSSSRLGRTALLCSSRLQHHSLTCAHVYTDNHGHPLPFLVPASSSSRASPGLAGWSGAMPWGVQGERRALPLELVHRAPPSLIRAPETWGRPALPEQEPRLRR